MGFPGHQPLQHMAKIHQRLQPLLAKITGGAPLCPWGSAFAPFAPGTFGVIPPTMDIKELGRDSGVKQLEFAGKHAFWFPESMPVDAELWSEYLVGFWESPTNYHHYTSVRIGVAKGDVVVDCGACEGFFTRAALEAGARRVVCVEPSSIMSECLKRTFSGELAKGSVVIEDSAIGSHEGTAGFSESSVFGGHISVGGDSSVKLLTLDRLAEKHGVPAFVKMDLEGAEYEALSGGKELLSSHRPQLAVTTYHNPWDYPVIHAFLVSMGYQFIFSKGVTLRDGRVPRPVLIQAK